MKWLNALIILCCFFGLMSVGHAHDKKVTDTKNNDFKSSDFKNSDAVSQIDLDVHKGRIKSKSLVVTTPIIYKAFQQKRPNRPRTVSESEPAQQTANDTANTTANSTQDNSDKDLYIRVNNIDYFVKFCSSKVKRVEIDKAIEKAIIKAIAKQKRQNKTQRPLLTLDITLTEGSWDICQHDSMLTQSRIGKYAVVHRIVHASKVKDKF